MRWTVDELKAWKKYTDHKAIREKPQTGRVISFNYKTEKERRDAVEQKCKEHLGHEQDVLFSNFTWDGTTTIWHNVGEGGHQYFRIIIDDNGLVDLQEQL